jgi:hypothetical protein
VTLPRYEGRLWPRWLGSSLRKPQCNHGGCTARAAFPAAQCSVLRRDSDRDGYAIAGVRVTMAAKWGLKPGPPRNRASAMKNLRCVSLFLIALPVVLASCSETAVPTAPARASAKIQSPAAQPAAKPGPRQCTTPDQVCPYGTGPAGEPCSCWATDGSPDTGITTIETPAARTSAPKTSLLYKG